MNKDVKRMTLALSILLILYMALMFLVPFEKGTNFVIVVVFTVLAFCVAGWSIYTAFIRKPDAKSRFYGFSIAKLGVIYCVIQIIASIVLAVIGQKLLWWFDFLVCLFLLGITLIGLISVEAVVEEIQIQEVKIKKDTSVMRELQSAMRLLAAQSDELQVNSELKKLAEEFKYSDPVSSEETKEFEEQLKENVDEMKKALQVSNETVVKELCKKTLILLQERNQICKMNK